MLFRRARENDLEAIYELAKHAGIGMTTLPKDKQFLRQRLRWSCDSFQKKVTQPAQEYYLFVLEEPTTHKVVGTAAIEGLIGDPFPYYSYKLSRHVSHCPSLNIESHYEVLTLANDYQGYSELCSLFLEPAFRKNSNGLLLSRARFLFIAQFLNRFAKGLIAELRGVTDEKGNSPFWEHLGQHFFHMPFQKADQLTLSTNKQFIVDLMPREPVYVNLLDPLAQQVIGKPHPFSRPAMSILLNEGFRYKAYVDIFDAGPTLEASVGKIRTLTTSHLIKVKATSEAIHSPPFLIANSQLDFRATVSQAVLNGDTCIITSQAAMLLGVNCGDYLRISPVHLPILSQ